MLKLFFVFIIMLNLSWAGNSIKGTVKGADGKVPEVAHAHISLLEGSIYSPLKSVVVDNKGQFSIDLENGKYYTLYITAANHYGLELPILIDEKDAQIKVEAQLKSYTLQESFDDVKIIGDWNKFKFSSAEEMEKQADGTYTFEYKSDQEKVAYQLVNVEKTGHSVNGTMQDELEYDGGGDYKSIVKTSNGVAKIVFDPAKLLQTTNTGLPTAKFTGNENLNTLLSISQKFTDERQKYYNEREQSPDKDNFKYNWTSFGSFLEKKMADKNPIISRYAASKYVSVSQYGFEEAKMDQVIKILPISDPLWVLNAFYIEDVFKKAMGDKKAGKYITNNFTKIPSKKVQAAILAQQGLQAKNNDQMEKVAEIHSILTTDYKDVKDRTLQYYVGQLDPGNTIAKGKPVPAFQVTLIHSDETVSNESMLGKYYMMDFWAVWCAPCRAEMPKLHDAFKEFSSDKFTILSLSFDPKLDAVDKYRKEAWAMPWLHTFVEGGFNNELSKRFEVTGIPKPLLVNPQGIIVATGLELRGENLKKTLTKYLNTTM